MAQPLSSLGLVGSIVHFLDFSSKLVASTNEIHNSTEGASGNHLHVETISNDLLALCTDLKSSTPSKTKTLTATEKSLITLTTQCEEDAAKLLHVLDKLKDRNKTSIWGSFRQALRCVWKEKKIYSLEKRLVDYRSQLSVHMIAMFRYENELQILMIDLTIAPSDQQSGLLGFFHKLEEDIKRVELDRT